MAFKHIYHFRVEWGDADPARIVFYPNYFRWMDAANHNAFESAGIDNNYLLDRGYIGFPITEVNAQFKRPGLYADKMWVETTVEDIAEKSFKCVYRFFRKDATGNTLILESYEKRILGQPHPSDPKRIVAAVLPDELIKKLQGVVEGESPASPKEH
jgi:4-hydroxybenzoyl-CoA thioesterase